MKAVKVKTINGHFLFVFAVRRRFFYFYDKLVIGNKTDAVNWQICEFGRICLVSFVQGHYERFFVAASRTLPVDI